MLFGPLNPESVAMVFQVMQGQERCTLAFKLQAKGGAALNRPPPLQLEQVPVQQAPQPSPKLSFWADLKELFHRRPRKSITLPPSPVRITRTPIGRNAPDATMQVLLAPKTLIVLRS